jgi:hypothetical protein
VQEVTRQNLTAFPRQTFLPQLRLSEWGATLYVESAFSFLPIIKILFRIMAENQGFKGFLSDGIEALKLVR